MNLKESQDVLEINLKADIHRRPPILAVLHSFKNLSEFRDFMSLSLWQNLVDLFFFFFCILRALRRTQVTILFWNCISKKERAGGTPTEVQPSLGEAQMSYVTRDLQGSSYIIIHPAVRAYGFLYEDSHAVGGGSSMAPLL